MCTSFDSTVTIHECHKSTPAACVPSWRSKLRESIIANVNGNPMSTISGTKQAMANAPSKQNINIKLTPPTKIPSHPHCNVPMMHFDQLLEVAKHHNAMREQQKQTTEPTSASSDDSEHHESLTENLTLTVIMDGNIKPKLTRQFLHEQLDWDMWNGVSSINSMCMRLKRCLVPQNQHHKQETYPPHLELCHQTRWNKKSKMHHQWKSSFKRISHHWSKPCHRTQTK